MRRFLGRHAGQVGDQDAAGLRLPPRIDDGTAALANIVMIPMPGLFVDGFTHSAEYTKRTQILILHEVQTKAHEAADGRRRRIEDIDLKLVHYIPKPSRIGIGGNAFEHQRSRAGAQRTIDDIAMSRDPADVRGTEIDLAGFILKYIDETVVGEDHIAPAGVYDPFGFAGRAGGIKNEQRIFRIHHLDRTGGVALRLDLADLVFPPYVAALDHAHGDTGAGQHDHPFDAGASYQRVIDPRFQRDILAATIGAVGGDHEIALGVLDAVRNALSRKAAK